MSTAISSLSSTSWVSSLFTKIDTKNQGYIDKSELQTALEQISSDSNTSSSSVDKIFSKLDVDNDGKITKQEMSDGMQKLADELDSQFNQSRLSGASGEDTGFTKDELTSQLDEIGDTDSKRSTLIQSIIDNFETADTDSDGKVSNSEAMAYDQSVNGTSSASSTSSTSGAGAMPPPPPPPSSTSSSDSSKSYAAADTNKDGTVSLEELLAYQSESNVTSSSEEMGVMKIMMQLMEAYGLSSNDSTQASISSSISAIA
jgi:Ca2+-binding EF-hand superfamily protein